MHTLRADLDYATSEAHTTYGIIGIKVWIFKGEILGRDDFASQNASLLDNEKKKAFKNLLHRSIVNQVLEI